MSRNNENTVQYFPVEQLLFFLNKEGIVITPFHHIVNCSNATLEFTDLPTPKYFCPYSEQPMSIFSDFWPAYFADAPPNSQNKAVSKVKFSNIHLVRTGCQLTFSIIQTYYNQTTLFCLHLQKSFSIEDHITLSPKAMHCVCCFCWCPRVLSWTVAFWSEFVSLVSSILPPLRRFCAATYHRQLSPPNQKLANFCKVSMQSPCSLV